jgi:hypothetical protein
MTAFGLAGRAFLAASRRANVERSDGVEGRQTS